MSEQLTDLAGLDRPVVLIGFMGAGKSSIGKRLAARLNRPFLDVDSFIEEQHGHSIPQLFVEHGEEHFRRLEESIIAELVGNGPNVVMALGGGAYESEVTRRLLEDAAIVVYLEVDWSDIDRNLHVLRPGRPVLADLTNEEAHALFLRRAVAYEMAPVVVHLSRTGVIRAVEQVYEAVRRYVSLP